MCFERVATSETEARVKGRGKQKYREIKTRGETDCVDGRGNRKRNTERRVGEQARKRWSYRARRQPEEWESVRRIVGRGEKSGQRWGKI